MAAVVAEGLNRRRVTVLAADVCGYSRLVAQDEQGTLARLLADRRIIGERVAAEAGRVFNTAGDALLAEFDTSAAALASAVAIQQGIERVNAAAPEARRLRYRIGVTVGDVLDEDGDLLGDAVNVASRLEKLAEPGGICLSRAVFEDAAGSFRYAVRDIGLQRLKNIPNPVRACLVSPEAIGGTAGPSRRPATFVAIVLGLALVAGGVAAVWAHRSRGVADGTAMTGGMIFPPEATIPAPSKTETARRFVLSDVPHLTDAARARLGAALSTEPDSAVAISRLGIVGVAPASGDPDQAGEDAIRRCFEAGGLNCRLYAIDGRVVWPDPLPPLPPEPWVDPAVPAVPFDADRISGLTPEHRRRLADEYPRAKSFKALALGPRGTWQFTSDKASAAEAERLALERCGESSGSPCRIVAVGNDFVVPLRKP